MCHCTWKLESVRGYPNAIIVDKIIREPIELPGSPAIRPNAIKLTITNFLIVTYQQSEHSLSMQIESKFMYVPLGSRLIESLLLEAIFC